MSDLRKRLASLVDEFITDDLLKAHIMDAFEAEKPISVHIRCKGCNREYWYKTKAPDAVARIKALSELLNQAKGTPAQTIRQNVAVQVNSISDLESLSDEQLLEIVNTGGSFRELPPPSGG